MNYADAHVHVYAPGGGAPQPPRFTVEDLLSHAKPAGVSRVVLIQISHYKFDNSYMLRALKDHPGMFSAVSAVSVVDHDRPDLDAAVADLARQGTRGFRINARGFDSPGMERLWKLATAAGIAMCPLINPDALPVIDQWCTRFPTTKVVIDHMARIGATGEIRDSDIRLLCGLAKHRNVYVKVSAFYALGSKRPPYLDLVPMIQRLVEDYGPCRLMWASDAPFQVINGHTYAASVDLVKSKLPFLNSGDREWILSRTAAQVFF
ncbi:MAG: amidohydrolase [Acidobacteria bacterium]|nr:amidohydrolase [Acidobacteriota bacterium]